MTRRVLPGFRLSLGVTLVYFAIIIALPLIALILKAASVGPEDYWRIVTSSRAVASYRVTVLSALVATIVNTLFGIILLGGLFFGQSLLGYVFNSAFKLTDEGWRKLTLRWGIFFLFLAVLNEVVWRNFSTDTWVAFKVWGTMPITIIFTMAQMPLVMRHSVEPLNKDDK